MNRAAGVIARLRGEAAAIGFEASLTNSIGKLQTVPAAAKPGGRILELDTGAVVAPPTCCSGLTAPAPSQLSSSTRTCPDLPTSRSPMSESTRWSLTAAAGSKISPPPRFRPRVRRYLARQVHPRGPPHCPARRPEGCTWSTICCRHPTGPDHHRRRVDDLITTLQAMPDLEHLSTDWATGVTICTKRSHLQLPDRPVASAHTHIGSSCGRVRLREASVAADRYRSRMCSSQSDRANPLQGER